MNKNKLAAGSVSALRNSIVALARRLRQSADTGEETWTELMVLGEIERGHGDATPTGLARALELRSSNLAQVLAMLEQRGLVQRSPDPADKRRVHLSLTEAGAARVLATRAQRDSWLSAIMDERLSAHERAQLIEAGTLMLRLAQPAVAKSAAGTDSH